MCVAIKKHAASKETACHTSANDHTGLTFVPQRFEGAVIDPVLVSFARIVFVVRIADVVAFHRVVATDETDMVVGRQLLRFTVDVKRFVAYRCPVKRLPQAAVPVTALQYAASGTGSME